jgi:hypothetical protein
VEPDIDALTRRMADVSAAWVAQRAKVAQEGAELSPGLRVGGPEFEGREDNPGLVESLQDVLAVFDDAIDNLTTLRAKLAGDG